MSFKRELFRIVQEELKGPKNANGLNNVLSS